MSLKDLAAAKGLTLGCGPVDPSGPLGLLFYGFDPEQPFDPPVEWDARFPYELDADTDPAAALILSEFAGLDLCPWAVGNTDVSHYGQAVRWTAPGVYNFTGCDETYAWAVANGLEISVSDPAYSGVPGWIQSGGYTAAQVSGLLHDWYQAFFTRYPLAHHTTFLNEFFPLWGHDEEGSVGPYSVDWYFQHSDIGKLGGKTRVEFGKTLCDWVHGFNPGIKILINQMRNEGVYGSPDTVPPTMIAWVTDLLNAGAPVAGIGVQGHFQNGVYFHQGIIPTLQSYAALGVEVYITEMDVLRGSDQNLWTDAYYNIIHNVIESGVVDHFSFWSIRDPLFWGLPGAIYDPNLNTTAAYDAVVNALSAPPEPPPALLSRNLMVGR